MSAQLPDPAASLYTIAALRAIERAAQAQLPPGILMQRAGAAAAARALQLVQSARTTNPILILAGPGNNGGDALECAAVLAAGGADVQVLLAADPQRLPTDARLAWQRACAGPVRWIEALPQQSCALIIDGLFGIGLTRPVVGPLRALIASVNQRAERILALDVPSGLNADTGNVIGPDGIALQATDTLTFLGDKPGLHTAAGRDYAGSVTLASLELEAANFAPSTLRLNSPRLFGHAAHPRRHASNKGSFGDVVVVGGADGTSGAVLLAARAALHGGAGRVHAAFLGTAPSHDPMQPELMCRSTALLEYGKAVVVIGPGLSTASPARAQLMLALQSSAPLVLDADALNLIAAEPEFKHRLARPRGALLLTPHPLEAARLLGCSVDAVQADRLAAAAELAQQCNAVVVLKGSGTVIARPDGALAINPTGNPALATGGTGDVLAGFCGALLAQGWPAWEAALGAVWLHGRAADQLVDDGIGPIGLCASDLLPQLRRALNQLTAQLRQLRQVSQHSTPAGRPQS